MDEEHIKQRKKDTPSDLPTSVPPPSSTTSIPNVIQTKEEYFEALRIWLQQVQLQQTAMAYFPYYLAANYQQTVGGSAFFLPPQFPAMFPDATQMPNGSTLPNIGAATPQINVDQQPAQPQPAFVNNLFQPNRNNYVDNARRNLEGTCSHFHPFHQFESGESCATVRRFWCVFVSVQFQSFSRTAATSMS